MSRYDFMKDRWISVKGMLARLAVAWSDMDVEMLVAFADAAWIRSDTAIAVGELAHEVCRSLRR